MIKNAIWSVITVITIILINYGITNKLEVAFFDYALITGIAITLAIWFFSSSGGVMSDSVRFNTQSMTGMKVDRETTAFNPSVVFYSSLLYTIVVLLVTAFLYLGYFI